MLRMLYFITKAEREFFKIELKLNHLANWKMSGQKDNLGLMMIL